MAKDIQPVHLLLLEPSSNDAETIITSLRNNGYPVRATQVVDEDTLAELLAKQSWDMCMTRAEVNGLNAQRVVELIDEYARDIPVLLITDEDNESDLISALRGGIKDAIPFASQERLFLVLKRELENLQQRKLRKKAEAKWAESEERCGLLLDSSQDAIAYIHEGMHIYSNQAYVDLFGFEEPDDMLAVPVMDMIDSDCHEDFKEFLRAYAKNPSHNSFTCRGIKSDDDAFDAIITLSNASYDNEDCTQVLIKTPTDNSELEAKVRELSAQDVLTGLYNQTYFQEQLNKLIPSDFEAGQSRNLLFAEIDQYEEVEKEFGLTGTDELITDVADFLSENAKEGSMLARYGNDSFMILLEESDPGQAKTSAEAFVTGIKKQMFEVEDKTLKITLSIGLCPVGAKADNAKDIISSAHMACVRAAKAGGDNVKVFNKLVDSGENEDGDLLEKIHDAIEQENLYVEYQPIVKLHGDERQMYQARVKLSEQAEINSKEMFTVAERAGISGKLDRWCITQSLKQLHNDKAAASIFIYLTVTSITDESFVDFVQTLLKSAKLPPSSLVFSVTANDAITYLKRVIVLRNGLRKLKVNFAINSVTDSQEHFTLIDQVLPDFALCEGNIVSEIATAPEAVERVRKICSEAHNHDILSIVPMVEDAATLAALWPVGVGYIQGYYLQAPMRKLDYDFSASEF